MPTLSGDFFFGSALAERAVRLLPCRECGSRGPHAFRVERERGTSVVCGDCQPESIHPSTSTAGSGR